MKMLDLKMEHPEEPITPALALALLDYDGLLDYEGTPGNQAGDPGASESHSAVLPEVRAGANPRPNP